MKQFFILIIFYTSVSFAQNDISYPFSSSGRSIWLNPNAARINGGLGINKTPRTGVSLDIEGWAEVSNGWTSTWGQEGMSFTTLNSINLYTAGTSRLFINSTGLGLSTITPRSKLHVVGDTILFQSNRKADVGIANIKLFSSFNGNGMFDITDSAGNRMFAIDSLGKITALSMKDGTLIKLSPFVNFGTTGSTTALTGTHFLVYGGSTSIGENAMPPSGFSINLSGNTIVKNKLSVLDTLRIGDYTVYSYIMPGEPNWTVSSSPDIKTNIQLYSMLDTTDDGLLNKFMSIKPVKYNFKKELLRGKTTVDTTGYFLKGDSLLAEQNKMIAADSTRAEVYSKIDHIGFLASEMSVLTGNEKEISGSEKEAIMWRVIQKLITQKRDQESRLKAIEIKLGM